MHGYSRVRAYLKIGLLALVIQGDVLYTTYMHRHLILLLMTVTLASTCSWAQWQRGARVLRGSVSRATSVATNAERQIARQMGVNALMPVIPAGISLQDPFLRGIFQARENTSGPTNLFSGTVFQTEYNGKKEVYVAVAAHALESGRYVLGKEFIGDVYVGDGKFKQVRMKIVQPSAPSMLDVAIGVPLEEVEGLRPFPLSREKFSPGNGAVSYGFAGQKVVVIPHRDYASQTPLCYRTTMPYPRDDRSGLCGSALLNGKGELLGIHTGSTLGKEGEGSDIGHTTNARLLNVLVDAYHHNGEGTFPLMLGGQKVLDLHVTSYISFIKLLDRDGKLLWQRGFESKFAYDQVNEKITALSPAMVELTVRRVHWDPASPDKLLEMRNSRDHTRRTYRYDFQEKKIVWESKPKE